MEDSPVHMLLIPSRKLYTLCSKNLWCSDALGLLELSSLGSDVWLGVGVWDTWGGTEMLLGLSILGSSQEESIGS